MRPRSLDAELDKLYQLPLDEFTAARNALARDAGGSAADIRALPKPPLPAWAVNQLYWKSRRIYDALIDAATTLRSAHKAVLGGRSGDLRGSSQAHDEALDRALKATLDLLADAGQKATEATRQAVLNILRALPSTDPPGRLARALQPGGFEMLTGFEIAPGKPTPGARLTPAPPSKKAHRGAEPSGSAALKKRAEAREAAAEAVRQVREAETELRRHEFAAARASKEADKAATRLEQAREALAAAEREVEDAERAVTAATKARDRARREAEDAQAAVDSARTRLERAQPEPRTTRMGPAE